MTLLSYIAKSYSQIKKEVITKFPTTIPENTDNSNSNPLIQGVNIWAGVGEMIGYDVNFKFGEAFIPTAKLKSSLIGHANSYGYRVRGVVAATVSLRFFFATAAPSDVLIPIGTQVSTPAGLVFTTTENATILLGQTEVLVDAKQQVVVTNQTIGTSDGTDNQRFLLEQGVADGSISISIGSDAWAAVENFFFSFQEDLNFVASLGEDNEMAVVFGDGVKGAIPTSSLDVIATYALSSGQAGNVPANTITQVVSSVPTPSGFVLQVNNPSRATGGVDIESIESLRRRIPLFFRTNDNAVTRKSYADVAVLTSGVADASVFFECGKFVEVFIIPEGGGLATQTLLDEVHDYFETRRMVTTSVKIRPAGFLQANLSVFLNIQDGFVASAVVANVRAALATYFSPPQQRIQGRVFISDVFEVIEQVGGVDNSSIELFKLTPYAQPLGVNETQLNWSRSVKPASNAIVAWEIRFVAPSIFQVIKNGTAIGNFSTNVAVILNELDFVILQNYSGGKFWRFHTYPYWQSSFLANIILQEPSLIGFSNEMTDIVITSQGGS